MPYSRIGKINQGLTSRTSCNYFGTGADGDFSTSGTTTVYSSGSDDTASYISNFETLTVNSGHTLSLTGRRRAWIIYVRGNCTINGSITMATGSSGAASVVNFNRYTVNGLTGSIVEPSTEVNFTTPAAGANGGAAKTSTGDGNTGSAGTNGKTGGGGSGAFNSAGGGSGSGAGAAGTSYSGGAGSGGYSSTTSGQAGGANGGAGGAGKAFTSSPYHAGGGAGNPGGTGSLGSTDPYAAYAGGTGTGGTLIICVGGNLTIGGSAVISANGTAGGVANQATSGHITTGGAGSGGGRVIIVYAGTLSNSGTIQANGGAGGVGSGGSVNQSGGAGGAGSVTSPTAIGT